MAEASSPSYRYDNAEHGYAHSYLLPALRQLLATTGEKRVFEIGCGNGSIAAALARDGYEMTGVDPSSEGIRHANRAYPTLRLFEASAYEPLAERFGTFPVVLTAEVIEHVYWPRRFVATCRSLLVPGGTLVMTTPYHAYLKNLVIALLGKFDHHVNPLWDGGHIKFWSEHTLSVLLEEGGFRDIRFRRVGRIPPLAKSMIAIATRSDG